MKNKLLFLTALCIGCFGIVNAMRQVNPLAIKNKIEKAGKNTDKLAQLYVDFEKMYGSAGLKVADKELKTAKIDISVVKTKAAAIKSGTTTTTTTITTGITGGGTTGGGTTGGGTTVIIADKTDAQDAIDLFKAKAKSGDQNAKNAFDFAQEYAKDALDAYDLLPGADKTWSAGERNAINAIVFTFVAGGGSTAGITGGGNAQAVKDFFTAVFTQENAPAFDNAKNAALTDYIGDNGEPATAKAEIKTALKNAGWTDVQIAAAGLS